MKKYWAVAVFLTFLATGALSQNLVGSLGYLPTIAESKDKGILVEYVKAMQKAYPEGKITFDVLPFKRSIERAIGGQEDFHAPILKDPTKTDKQLGFAYSDANVWDVIFALYTNKNNKKINIHNLSHYNIETDAAHVGYFNFPIKGSSCIECSLKKLNAGRIDGYIFAALESDSVIRRDHLTNIRSQFYHKYEGKFVLPLGPRGRKANLLISKIVKRTIANGDYNQILGKIINYYKTWKPIQ